MIGYQIALVFKFLGVALYAGGMAASFLSSSLIERKRAVHRVASPGLLLTWIAGFCLAEILHIRWTTPWNFGRLGAVDRLPDGARLFRLRSRCW